MVSFLGGKSNATLRNSHPLYWDGAMLLFNMQGSERETWVSTEVRARGTAVTLCSHSCVPLLGTGFSSAWVHHYKQGLMKQCLPYFNMVCGDTVTAGICPGEPFKEEAGPS
jgi:hypothetical protein